MKNKLIGLIVAGAMVVTMAGCGSSAGSSSAASSAASASAASESSAEETSVSAAEAVKAASTETVASASGSGSEDSADQWEGPTEAAKAPTGIKVAFVPNDATLSGCSVPLDAIQEIADKYDWETQTFDGQGTAEGCNKAILNAVGWKPDAIVCMSVLASSAQQGIKAAQDANIPIVSGSNGTDDPNPRLDLDYDFAYDVGPDYAGLGAKMADWVKANTTGSGKVVAYDCPGSYSVEYFKNGFYEEMEKIDVDYVEDSKFTFDQLGDELNRMIINYLTKNPDTEFVFVPFDPAAVSVTEGLEAAGFNDVKVLGVLGNTEMCTLISQGSIATATAAYDNVYLGYATADQMIRILDGQDLFTPHGENLPSTIIDATNVPAEGEAWTPSYDYKSEFYKLWD